MGDNFFQFESPQIQSNQFEYLVHSSLVQLCVASPEGVILPVLQPYFTGLDWQKWGLQEITADSASLHTSRCELMEQFQFSEKWQLKYLLFIDKGYHNFFVYVCTFISCITKPVDR